MDMEKMGAMTSLRDCANAHKQTLICANATKCPEVRLVLQGYVSKKSRGLVSQFIFCLCKSELLRLGKDHFVFLSLSPC